MSAALAAALGIALGLSPATPADRRHADHARRRRAADVSGNPYRAVDRRHRAMRCSGNIRESEPRSGCWCWRSALSFWVQFARTVRGMTFVEKNKDYVLAAHLIGIRPGLILVRHLLPNVIGPVLVILTINLALAIILEATLSFLGVGLSPTQPSLGTMIRLATTSCSAANGGSRSFPGSRLPRLPVGQSPRRLAARCPNPKLR